MKHKFAIAACARWESEFIVEWVNYYQMVGYDHIYLYCNDDTPHALYEKVLPFLIGDHPYVTFHFYPFLGQHRDMMLHFVDNYLDEVEWISFFDIDEFLRLPREQSIDGFMQEFEDRADSVLFNWVFFGPNGHKTHPGTPVLSTYTRRDPGIHPFTKYLTRSSVLSEGSFRRNCKNNSFVHNLQEYTDFRFCARNVIGDDMWDYYKGFPEASINFNNENDRNNRILEKAVIHHYAFRSEKAFHDRVARGLNGDFAAEKMWGDLAQSADFQGFLHHINHTEDWRLAEFRERIINRSLVTMVDKDWEATGLVSKTRR